MRVEIEIPKEFEEHFKQDKFKDSFERIMADIKYSLENGDCLCAGRYEYETIEMLQKAFENSRQAYPVGKVVEDLETMSQLITTKDMFKVHENVKMVATDIAIKIVKQGSVVDNVCEWKQDKGCVGLGAYNISCCDKTLEMPVSTARGLKYCTYCGKKIKVVE